MPDPSPSLLDLDALLQGFVRGFLRAWQVPPELPKPAPRKRARPAQPPPAPPSAPVAAPPRPRAGHEIVRYRQGRGTFEARIIRFDQATKQVVLERLSDGKRVLRPASKVYAEGKVQF